MEQWSTTIVSYLSTRVSYVILALLLFHYADAYGQATPKKRGFDVIALGTEGGVNADSLSAFLIGPTQQNVSVACDAGSLVNGIDRSIEKGAFSEDFIKDVPTDYPYSLTGYVLREHIKGYLITHAHLDHVAGLLLASVDDSSKPIYGFDSVIDTLKTDYFNWRAWPNFADKGKTPLLKKYSYHVLPEHKPYPLLNTPLSVVAIPLSHNGVVSSAFVIKHLDDIVVCLGDTGPDFVEGSQQLSKLWHYIAPYVKLGRVKAIIIESSFTNSQSDDSLFGHLTPKHIQSELSVLAKLVNQPNALSGLPVIISHIKPSLKKGRDPRSTIAKQLSENNVLNVNYIIPEQGQFWRFE